MAYFILISAAAATISPRPRRQELIEATINAVAIAVLAFSLEVCVCVIDGSTMQVRGNDPISIYITIP